MSKEKLTVGENMSRINLSQAEQYAAALVELVDSAFYTSPEEMPRRQEQAANLLNLFADSFNLNLAKNVQ